MSHTRRMVYKVIVVTILFWVALITFSVFVSYNGRKHYLLLIDHSVDDFFKQLKNMKIQSTEDVRYQPLFESVLMKPSSEIASKYVAECVFSNNTVFVIFTTRDSSGPKPETIMYIQDNQTGNRSCLPKEYDLMLKKYRKKNLKY